MPDVIQNLPEPKPRQPGAPLALEGLRVVDFTRFLAGPWCTQTLADLGAEVIKIEAPEGGDGTRIFTPPDLGGEAPYFLGLNRNKMSITLDLATEQARQIAFDLIDRADMLVENFSPGVMRRLGFDYDSVRQRNPKIIYCSATGYGSEGPFAELPGFDSVFQAESGFASLTGDPEGMPMRTGSPIIDIATSMNLTIAALAALAARDRHGRGQFVEVALFDTAVTLLSYYSMNYLASGDDPVRNGNTSPIGTPIGMFTTSDGGAIYISCSNQRTWERLAIGVLGRPDLVADPRFGDNRGRTQHQKILMAEISAMFAERPRKEWMEHLQREKVPAGAVRSVAEALGSPVSKARNLVTRIPHTAGADVPNISSPFHFSDTPVADPVAAPMLGEHNEKVLREVLSYSPEQVLSARKSGALGASAVRAAK